MKKLISIALSVAVILTQLSCLVPAYADDLSQAVKTMYSCDSVRYGNSPNTELDYDGVGADTRLRSYANTGAVDVIPLNSLGMKSYGTIKIVNNSKTFKYCVLAGNEYWCSTGASLWCEPNSTVSFAIPQYSVGIGISATIDGVTEFYPSQLDLQNLHLYYKGEEVDYLSVLSRFADEDSQKQNANAYATLGHNFDDPSLQALAVNKFGILGLDVNVNITKDGVPINVHDTVIVRDGKNYNVSVMTYDELVANGLYFQKIETLLSSYNPGDFLCYLDLKCSGNQAVKYVLPMVEQMGWLNSTVFGTERLNNLQTINQSYPNANLLCYGGAHTSWSDETISAFSALRTNSNKLFLVVGPACKEYYKLNELAKTFDYTSTVLLSYNLETGFLNARQIVDFCNSHSSNCMISTGNFAMIRTDLIYRRWNGNLDWQIEDLTTPTITPPKKSVIKNCKSSKKRITVNWKKVKGAKGYQIQCGENKKFTKSRTRTIKNSKARSTVFKSLKKNKKYYVRVRAYKIDYNDKKVYGKWSKVVAIKAK